MHRRLKAFLIILAVVVVIAGGSAAAYFGIILPNKPINVLKASLDNTLKEPYDNFSGTITNGSSQHFAYKVGYKGSINHSSKAADLKVNLTFFGVTFPVEARLVNQNIYIKIGDLSSVANLISGFSPKYSAIAQALTNRLSNKWIIIDSTLLQQTEANCYLSSSFNVSNTDINLMNTAYNKHAFITIKSTSSATVNGQSAKKFNLSLNDNKLAAYANDNALRNLSLSKDLQKCSKNPMNTVSKINGNNKNIPLTIWVANRHIVKIAYENNKVTEETTFSYTKTNITAPSGAEPAAQFLGQLQASSTNLKL